MFTDILVPVDGSETSFRALPVAASLAERFDATAHVLGAWGDLPKDVMIARIKLSTDAVLRGVKHAAILERHDRPVADIIYKAALSFGEPLLCMTTHGRGRSAALRGSVVAETLELLPNPVVLVGPQCLPQPLPNTGRLVVCTDGTDFADSIIPLVENFATTLGLTTEVVTVIDPRDLTDAGRNLPAGAVSSVAESSHVRAVSQQLAEATGLASTYEVLHDRDAARAIVDHVTVAPPAMIAMATHDEYRLKRILESSVTADVVRQVSCPVLTFRPTDTPT